MFSSGDIRPLHRAEVLFPIVPTTSAIEEHGSQAFRDIHPNIHARLRRLFLPALSIPGFEERGFASADSIPSIRRVDVLSLQAKYSAPEEHGPASAEDIQPNIRPSATTMFAAREYSLA